MVAARLAGQICGDSEAAHQDTGLGVSGNRLGKHVYRAGELAGDGYRRRGGHAVKSAMSDRSAWFGMSASFARASFVTGDVNLPRASHASMQDRS